MDGVPASHNPVLQEVLDLRPYINSSAAAVQESFSLDRTYVVFRTLGLRHLVVVDRHNHVKGIVTRKVQNPAVTCIAHVQKMTCGTMQAALSADNLGHLTVLKTWCKTMTQFTLCHHCIISYSALLQDLLGFRLDEAVEKEKGSSSGLVSLSRPSSASELAQQGNGNNE